MFRLDVKKEILNVNCPHCGKKIKLSFNSIACPYCYGEFIPDEVHKLFYQYEAHLINSKSYNATKKMEKTSDALINTGKGLSNLGCALTLLPLAILGLIIAWSILTN
ncbi:hypothetical protein [Enterococcus faecalis]|uniref:Zinc ribbon domain-containing protein n=3 Tax=Enterococcus faecalis TaxID=1351 RepID=A0A6B1XZV3_ENTFL|nr:hypothetical protein [Enterococcus faecalis]EGQ1522255.1 hypothetical protein [Staphylococcus aureus]EEI10936.1 hypothetical protein HMPREF0348_2507 [Enterococcus faecalis TX0104]EFQ17459.1 hypothetical protein HMPREF9512_00284 [Enterococcus faecalis EnGen0311]EFU91876.1 hypothetical protein HMPREF9511_00161 [Enterococcus faecalis TX0630]EJU96256.1 hypothetical protein HMPREF1330_01965 [Enterococcus faecalis ERV129]